MKLHIGSGKVRLNGWLNVDLAAPEADLHLDIRETLPFADETITHIFTEHLIEHVNREEAVRFLRECHRVLSKNGFLRISTPDLKHLVVSYISREIGEWGELWEPKSPCSLLNEGIRNWGHQFLYDAEELVKTLSEAGFYSVSFVNWGESTINELSGLETRPFHGDLIVEARKDGDVGLFNCKTSEDLENELWLEPFDRSELLKIISKSRRANLERDVEIDNINRIVADLTTHIRNVEADWSARGKHIESLEQIIADQATHIRNVETDWKARGETIADLINHIQNLEADWSARGKHIESLEQIIANQTRHINNIEAELMKFQSSWYGKLKSAIQKLHRFVTSR
jgi:predicted SAM-dependent methyltransferase